MTLKEALGLLAQSGVVCRFNGDSGYDLVTYHGRLTNEEVNYLCDAGFAYTMNGYIRLSDEGRAAYLSSIDELQGGMLHAPGHTRRMWPGEASND